MAAAGILLAGVSFWYVPWSLPRLTGRNGGQDKFLKYSLAPLVVSGCLLTAAWEAYANHAAPRGQLSIPLLRAGRRAGARLRLAPGRPECAEHPRYCGLDRTGGRLTFVPDPGQWIKPGRPGFLCGIQCAGVDRLGRADRGIVHRPGQQTHHR